MGFEYRLQETCPSGSFRMWGVGLQYIYNAHTNELAIAYGRSKSLLLTLNLSDDLDLPPQIFASYLERSSQIKSLIMSNHQSINIAGQVDPKRLAPIVQSMTRLAKYACYFDLNLEHKFCESFASDYDFTKLLLHKLCCPRSRTHYYRARFISKNGHEALVRAPALIDALRALSENIMSNILPLELSTNYKDLENLMAVSTRLSLLSKIMNESFSPQISLINVQQNTKKINAQKDAGTVL